jgi:hypothetical protein
MSDHFDVETALSLTAVEKVLGTYFLEYWLGPRIYTERSSDEEKVVWRWRLML